MTVVCFSWYLFCLLLVGHQVPWCWNVRVFAQDLIMPVCCKRRASSKASILIKWKRVVWKIVTLQIKRVVWAATGRLLQHFKLVKDKSLWMVSFGTEQFESKRVLVEIPWNVLLMFIFTACLLAAIEAIFFKVETRKRVLAVSRCLAMASLLMLLRMRIGLHVAESS